MFGEDGNNSSRSSNNDDQDEALVDKVATHNKYIHLKRDY
jgi:hypothetical protein